MNSTSRRFAALGIALAALAACTAPSSHAPKAPPGLDSAEVYNGPGQPADAQRVAPTSLTPRATPPASAPPAMIHGVQTRPAELKPDPALISDAGIRDLRVSASRGEVGGAVILWPRVIPSNLTEAMRPQATAIQQQLRQAVTHAAPAKTQDVRPEPERVCPRAGCLGASVGALLATSPGGGCAVVALVAPPGAGSMRLIPWIGEVTLKKDVIDFREPPESFVVIEDYSSCDGLPARLAQGNPALEAALRGL